MYRYFKPNEYLCENVSIDLCNLNFHNESHSLFSAKLSERDSSDSLFQLIEPQ